MALSIKTITDLHDYFSGVMNRANHHANSVNEVILTILGGVIWKSTENFQVRTIRNETANVLWMILNHKRYCFKYNHERDEIQVCKNSHRGEVIMTFTNNTNTKEVKNFFVQLN